MLWLGASIGLGLMGCANSASPASEGIAPLWGTEWQLEAIGKQAVVAQSKASLRFEQNGQVAGHGSCNRFSGAATVTGSRMSIGPLASTKMACMGPAMDQESAYLGALEKATRFEMQGKDLLIHSSEPAQTLRFRRAP
jgi:heat shock protein HslJ